jgi:hypothetical protein
MRAKMKIKAEAGESLENVAFFTHGIPPASALSSVTSFVAYRRSFL